MGWSTTFTQNWKLCSQSASTGNIEASGPEACPVLSVHGYWDWLLEWIPATLCPWWFRTAVPLPKICDPHTHKLSHAGYGIKHWLIKRQSVCWRMAVGTISWTARIGEGYKIFTHGLRGERIHNIWKEREKKQLRMLYILWWYFPPPFWRVKVGVTAVHAISNIFWMVIQWTCGLSGNQYMNSCNADKLTNWSTSDDPNPGLYLGLRLSCQNKHWGSIIWRHTHSVTGSEGCRGRLRSKISAACKTNCVWPWFACWVTSTSTWINAFCVVSHLSRVCPYTKRLKTANRDTLTISRTDQWNGWLSGGDSKSEAEDEWLCCPNLQDQSICRLGLRSLKWNLPFHHTAQLKQLCMKPRNMSMNCVIGATAYLFLKCHHGPSPSVIGGPSLRHHHL